MIYSIKNFLILISAACTLVFFTNAGQMDPEVLKMLAEYDKVQSAIEDPNTSPNLKEMFEAHKLTIINVVSSKNKMKNCSELALLFPEIKTGIYGVSPKVKKAKHKESYCEFSEGALIVEKPLVSDSFADRKLASILKKKRKKIFNAIFKSINGK